MGDAVGTVSATDPDEDDTVSYSITVGERRTASLQHRRRDGCDHRGGRPWTTRLTDAHTLTVEVSDDGEGGTATVTVTVTVTDVVGRPVIRRGPLRLRGCGGRRGR